ncbi:hypothetical protein KP509_12G066300 [Ceratopteris richardii]|uniref:F-box domain-containing protein n=1 Tax=Ceratopteris richardii TaxID=49495 RepID=A0A8T2TJX6_CERRI|nr:hypothetical protein KP509_12G066300 [Ceratopteris richardii]
MQEGFIATTRLPRLNEMEQLPENVLLLIFSKLNALDVIRAGLSCESLRALAISAAHLIPGSLVSFASTDSRGFPYFWVHDPSRNAWLSLPLDFLDSSVMCDWNFLPSDGGLVCTQESRLMNPNSDNDWIRQAINVFNPITGSWRLIPYPRKRGHPQAFGIKYISVSDGYELFALIECSARSYTMLRYAALTYLRGGLWHLSVLRRGLSSSTALLFAAIQSYTRYGRRSTI